MTASLSLWAGVAAIGVYHGLNPAMGWPLAVARGMERRSGAAVLATWLPLGAGHLAAMALVLVPFALLSWMLTWSHEIRLGAGALVVLFGLWRLVVRRHPRWLARVRPTQIAWWSFLMATAHGAALMLLPILLGLCGPAADATADGGMAAHGALMRGLASSVGAAFGVSLLHTTAMIVSGLAMAWLVYRTLGLKALQTAWLNLDAVWALGLVVSGGAALALAWTGG